MQATVNKAIIYLTQESDDDFFSDVANVGCDNELIIVLRAFFDESERPSGIFCVAGFAFQKRASRMFKRDWLRLFGSSGAHMADLVAGRQQFKGMSREQRDSLIRKAVPIIKKHITAGVAITCNVHEVRRLSPRWIRGYGHAYPVCCHLAMYALGNWLRDSGSPERVTYIFEAGHRFEAEANGFMGNVVRAAMLKEAFRYHGHAFLPKSDAIPLQAADFLAWEWAKFRDETLEQRIRPMRGSLLALFSDDVKKLSGAHVTGPPLVKYMAQIRQLGLEQIKEERQKGLPI